MIWLMIWLMILIIIWVLCGYYAIEKIDWIKLEKEMRG
jgi:hypothetical protein